MSGDAFWYREGEQGGSGDPPAQPPGQPPPAGQARWAPPALPSRRRAPGSEWALPIVFLVSVGVFLLSIPGRFYVHDFFGNLIFPTGMLATGTGIAVAIMAPERSLPERTRTALQAVRVAAGVFLGLVVALVFFIAYLIGQAMSDPNTE